MHSIRIIFILLINFFLLFILIDFGSDDMDVCLRFLNRLHDCSPGLMGTCYSVMLYRCEDGERVFLLI